MKILETGIPNTLDASEELVFNECNTFTLRAYLLGGIADQPAMNKLIRMKGAGGMKGCRMCMIEGVLKPRGTIYFYYHSNAILQQEQQLPLRTQMRDLHAAVEELPDGMKKHIQKTTGISFMPALIELKAPNLNRGFVYDIFHLILQNIAKDWFTMWHGMAKFDTQEERYILSTLMWDAMGVKFGYSIKVAIS
ncbi:hypothetical protein DFH27DRAFT_482569 [Peziza echinospora]|nr:hypothetical protein DFH27DRAFT_489109 [Peziza echinospora]KAI5800404.1 hypothetical protein DFH27DRAFT_482569 [Peziza echinospora]